MGFDVLSIVQMIGGLALFIYGMTTMGKGLERAAGSKLEKTLEKMTGNVVTALLMGMVVTMVIQSSSATTVMVVGFVNAGLMNLTQAISVIMGANIGTTITANLAALTGNTQARRAALAHLVFNVFGVIWVLCLFTPFTEAVSWFVENVMGTKDPAVAVSFKLSAFHTCFNICNVLILIWLKR